MSTLDTYARAGIEAVNQRKLDVAIENFQKALAFDPDRPDLNNALGMAYLNRGEAVSALPHLLAASRLAEPYDGPEHQDMRKHFETGLATCLLVLDRVRDAVAVLERAAARWPDDLQVRTQHASALVSSCLVDEGRRAYAAIADDERFEDEIREAADAIAGAIEAVVDDEEIDGAVFLKGHAEAYRTFFGEHAHQLVAEGWYAEAARLVRGADGQPQPLIAEGARPWAVERVDIVNPSTGEAAKVGDEKDPHIIAVNGLEPLAQLPVTLPYKGWPFDVWVCSRSPWHWLGVTIQFADERPEAERDALTDEIVGSWYLDGYNGSFGESDMGRFHYATNPEFIGSASIAWMFDLGRASFDAIPDLLGRLAVLHERAPIRRVLFGQGRLPDGA
jgi:tetratricopeptide (TPR) repeat protein